MILSFLLVVVASQSAQQPPRLLFLYRDSLKHGVDSAFRAIENEAAQICANLKCPNRYIAFESLTGPHEAWWITPLASAADTTRIVAGYAANPPLVAALAGIGRQKGSLIGTPVRGYVTYRADRSNGPAWNLAGARFVVATITRGGRAVQGAEWDAADGTRYIMSVAVTRSQADSMAERRGAGTRVLAVRPNWSMPDSAWVKADPEFWREAPHQ